MSESHCKQLTQNGFLTNTENSNINVYPSNELKDMSTEKLLWTTDDNIDIETRVELLPNNIKEVSSIENCLEWPENSLNSFKSINIQKSTSESISCMFRMRVFFVIFSIFTSTCLVVVIIIKLSMAVTYDYFLDLLKGNPFKIDLLLLLINVILKCFIIKSSSMACRISSMVGVLIIFTLATCYHLFYNSFDELSINSFLLQDFHRYLDD